MNADEMFKELGYYQLKVLGAQECDFSNGKGKEIIFTKNKKVGLYGIYNWISMQELQAINKKCEELRMDKIIGGTKV